MANAVPAQYKVERLGGDDPLEARYLVLDLVHDEHARQIAWQLARTYRGSNAAVNAGGSAKADEIEQLLKDTEQASMSYFSARSASMPNRVGRPRSARPRR